MGAFLDSIRLGELLTGGVLQLLGSMDSEPNKMVTLRVSRRRLVTRRHNNLRVGLI